MQRKLTYLMMLVAVFAAADFLCLAARAQSPPLAGRKIDYNKDGVRFQIKASIPAVAASSHDEKTASLYVKLRISAHATGSSYFGEIMKYFPNVWLNKGSDEMLYWEDGRCHQRRGLPKITVTAIDGAIKADKGKFDVEARSRQLGLLLPHDEILAGRRLPGGRDKDGKYIAFRSRTKASHLAVDVKVVTKDCNLAGHAALVPR